MFSCISTQLNHTNAIVNNNCDVYFNPYTKFCKTDRVKKVESTFGLRVKYPTVHICSGWIKSKFLTQ